MAVPLGWLDPLQGSDSTARNPAPVHAGKDGDNQGESTVPKRDKRTPRDNSGSRRCSPGAARVFYVQYHLHCCIQRPADRYYVLSDLHEQIQGAFNEYGVQIMSPNFEAQPDCPVLVPKEP